MLDLNDFTTLESIRLVGNHILIEPTNTESLSEYTTKSGIQVVQSNYRSKRKSLLGKIAKLGSYITEGRQRVPLTDYFNIGDTVAYFEVGTTEVKLDNKTYLIVRAEDIDFVVV